ncbi:hypothetical protein [Maridesulfovibrio sp.]|uniref:hypothetical protein n=1 Tax=Maridesulfovibrio sp. TaxID=2795000 RepID=UPI0029C9BE10|nr:hypothetical protein [Maridesulfovibrio sp.]
MDKKNPNHPEKGSSIKVDPITSLKDIANLKKLLEDNPRDLALFVLGINTNLRAIDLVQIEAAQFVNAEVGDELLLKEQKTAKDRRITLNASVMKAVRPWAIRCRDMEQEYLFTDVTASI